MQRIHSSDLTQFQIIQLKPQSIIMRHIHTRKMYAYTELPLFLSKQHKQIGSDIIKQICQPLHAHSGYLFELGMINLDQQLRTIRKQHTSQRKQREIREQQKCKDLEMDKNGLEDREEYWLNQEQNQSEQMTRNTIEAIIRIVQKLHNNNIVHGAVSAQSVFVDEFGEINMYYPGLENWRKQYYPFNNNPEQQNQLVSTIDDDYYAIGILALKMLGLYSTDQFRPNITAHLKNGSIHFNMFIILTILLYKHQKFYPLLPSLLQSAIKFKCYSQLDIFKLSNKSSKQNKTTHKLKTENNNQSILNKRYFAQEQFTPPLIKHSHDQLSPRKMLQITKKLMKIQDCQNKKVTLKGKEEEFFTTKRKKNNNDTALKKMSNGKLAGAQTTNVGYMVLRGENYESPKANKNVNQGGGVSPGTKRHLKEVKQIKQKQDFYKLGAIIRQRMRTISKKKIGNNY